MLDLGFDSMDKPTGTGAFQNLLKNERGLTPDKQWSMPCYHLRGVSEVPELIGFANQTGLPISLAIGMGTNADELVDLGARAGGVVLGVDKDFLPNHGYREQITGDFVVVIAKGEVRDLPAEFAKGSQVLFPSPGSYLEPVLKAADVIESGGNLFLALDPTVVYAPGLYRPEDLLEYISRLIRAEGDFSINPEIIDWETYGLMYPRSSIHRGNLSPGHQIPVIKAVKY